MASAIRAVTRDARITGATRLYVVVGDPVDQVKAPGLLNPVFAEEGVDAVVIPVRAAPTDFGRVLDGLRLIDNLDGVLVTVPHKMAACRLAHRRSPEAELTGSANVLRREPDGTWTADNFDGAGFVHGLAAAGHDLAGATVALVGAGGAGSAIAAAVLAAGAARLTVRDTDPGRAADLLARLRSHWPGRVAGTAAADFDGVDVVVNATPLGLHPTDPLPVDPCELPPGCLVADIIMRPHETTLLRTAAERGHPVHHGIHMLTHQVALYRGFFDWSPGGNRPR